MDTYKRDTHKQIELQRILATAEQKHQELVDAAMLLSPNSAGYQTYRQQIKKAKQRLDELQNAYDAVSKQLKNKRQKAKSNETRVRELMDLIHQTHERAWAATEHYRLVAEQAADALEAIEQENEAALKEIDELTEGNLSALKLPRPDLRLEYSPRRILLQSPIELVVMRENKRIDQTMKERWQDEATEDQQKQQERLATQEAKRLELIGG